MEKKVILQKIKKVEKDPLGIAQKYYNILAIMNDFKLTEREIQLVAFTAVKGNISYSTNREEFCLLYKSSSPTINNIISKLKKLNILIKDGTKIKVNPAILIDFTKNIILQLSLSNG